MLKSIAVFYDDKPMLILLNGFIKRSLVSVSNNLIIG